MFKEEPLSPVHTRDGFAGVLKVLVILLVLSVVCLGMATALNILPFQLLAGTMLRIGLIVAMLGSAVAVCWLMMWKRRA